MQAPSGIFAYLTPWKGIVMKQQTQLPTLRQLKTQASRLRASMAKDGDLISHSEALEYLAHQFGFRNWNTLSAAAPEAASFENLQLESRVSGRYLGHAFAGKIIGVSKLGTDKIRITLDFDKPVDVVTSKAFSSFRRRVSATIDHAGKTTEKTSDQQPQLVLEQIL